MQKLRMRLFYFPGAVLHHLLQTPGHLLLFSSHPRDVSTHFNEFGNLSVFLKHGKNRDIDIVLSAVMVYACEDILAWLLALDSLIQRTLDAVYGALGIEFLKDLIALPADDLFKGVAHLVKERLIHLDNFPVGCDDNDEILNAVQNRVNFLIPSPKLLVFCVDGFPEKLG